MLGSHQAQRRRHGARVALLAATAAALLLAGCGQTSPPSPQEVQENIQYFVLPGVTAANGKPVMCVMYDSGTHGTNNSKSWFAFACDFTGTADFSHVTVVPLPSDVPVSPFPESTYPSGTPSS